MSFECTLAPCASEKRRAGIESALFSRAHGELRKIRLERNPRPCDEAAGGLFSGRAISTSSKTSLSESCFCHKAARFVLTTCLKRFGPGVVYKIAAFPPNRYKRSKMSKSSTSKECLRSSPIRKKPRRFWGSPLSRFGESGSSTGFHDARRGDADPFMGSNY